MDWDNFTIPKTRLEDLGHAGVMLIRGRDGMTKYYEYGRYDPANLGRVRRVAIPAKYETVTRTTKTTDERMEWRQVMCEVNMTHDNVLALQKALADKGYYKAGLDGIIGNQTLSAARRYAVENNLPAGSNYVPVEVVKSLDLKL